jgi:NAD(P)-dependent dehydrogenase (short-subunit alcohol dehydrogenase family)
MKLANKHIFVTGGAKGIGEAIVRDSAKEGASVSFVDIDVTAGEKLVSELTALGQKVVFVKADVVTGVDKCPTEGSLLYGLIKFAIVI